MAERRQRNIQSPRQRFYRTADKTRWRLERAEDAELHGFHVPQRKFKKLQDVERGALKAAARGRF